MGASIGDGGANAVEPAQRVVAALVAAVALISAAVVPVRAASIRPGLVLGLRTFRIIFGTLQGARAAAEGRRGASTYRPR